jgi:O-antigen/teichoic acid export membrane protein
VVVSFSTSGESSSVITFVIVVFGFSAGLQIYAQIFSALLIASKKIYIDNVIQLTLNILGYILILIFVPLYGLVALASINLFVIILIIVRSSLRVKSLFPQLKITRQAFSKASLLSF